MKHRVVDLGSEIDRISLPEGLHGFLFPMFESISNALHSIEDRFAEDCHARGEIRIFFDTEAKSIKISDNGNGFDKRNLNAFLTPFTGNKLHRNGKGFGRFVSFKVFQEVFYSTKMQGNKDDYHDATFAYLPLDPDDNLVDFKDDDLVQKHGFERGLTVYLHSPHPEYEIFFKFGSKALPNYSEEDIVIAVLDHFLLDFVQKRTPQRITLTIDGVVFNLNDYYSSSLKDISSNAIKIEIAGAEHVFAFSYVAVDAAKVNRHSLYFYSDKRAASDLENISKGLKDGPFETENGDKYYYLVAAESDYFESSQSRDKITNLNVKVLWQGQSKLLKEVLIAFAKETILALEPSYTSGKRSVIKKHVEELIALDPMLRRGLGQQSIDEFVSARGILETKEQIASDLFIVRMRSKFDFRKINSTTPFEELQRVVKEKIPDDAKEALAVYVAYRSDVIKILKEMLRRGEDGLAKEDAVHQLVYPRYKDSEEVDYSSHNLWLVDDDLAFADYISSDRTANGTRRGPGLYAHDILVNNQNELLLVEMKRPQKTTYDTTEDARSPTDNPVQQLMNQVSQIREVGKVQSSGGREIIIPNDKMVRGYILADWNDKFRTYLKDHDFILTESGGPMAYRYFAARNLMIEVLAFDRLADRAAKRNEVFRQILEGRSDYAGKTISLLDVRTIQAV
jgi:hypothetical protein